MSVVRIVSASVLLALLVVAFATPQASASGAQPQKKFVWSWEGDVTIYLDKDETAYLALGSAAVSRFAAWLPPPINYWISGSAALLTAYAAKAVVDRKCMKIKLTPPIKTLLVFWRDRHVVKPGKYSPKDEKYGRYCR